MTAALDPYLSFDGNAREALEFYREALGGEVSSMTYGEMGDDGPHRDKLMHGHLKTDAGLTLMAADTPPGTEHRPGENISICLSGFTADAEELRGYWERLTVGAEVTVPLAKQMWGDEYGAFTDRFGIPWMVDFGDPPS